MPRVHVDYEDWDDLEDEFPSEERIIRRPKEEKDAFHKKGSKHNPDAAKRKEYVERD